jgi:hypothetical protein
MLIIIIIIIIITKRDFHVKIVPCWRHVYNQATKQVCHNFLTCEAIAKVFKALLTMKHLIPAKFFGHNDRLWA